MPRAAFTFSKLVLSTSDERFAYTTASAPFLTSSRSWSVRRLELRLFMSLFNASVSVFRFSSLPGSVVPGSGLLGLGSLGSGLLGFGSTESSFGIASFSRTFLHTVHSVCLSPSLSAVGSLSIIQSLTVCFPVGYLLTQ